VDFSQEKLLSIGIVVLLTVSGIASFVYYKDNYGDSSNNNYGWVDPVTEITGPGNHTHTNLSEHFLMTDNMTLIDYHNLNCDGQLKPETDPENGWVGRPCYSNFKNTAPTPGDNSEVIIEGDFPDCVEGCYAYVAAYNQFHILDIREPNNVQLMSTYYADIARIIDIKVTQDNNWVLINHELTNSELDPIPTGSELNSGMNRLDLIDVSNKNYPVKRAEWNNPPAGFHNQDVHVYCDWDNAPPTQQDECHVFLFGADPYPEIIAGGVGYKGTQIFWAPDFGSIIPGTGENESARAIERHGGYTPDPATTCGGTVFNHDNVLHRHPITGQLLLYAAYWDAGLRIVDVSNPPTVPDPLGLSWPQNNEVGRWMGCSSANDGWYGPDGGGHAGMSAEEWTSPPDGNGNIHYVIPYDHLVCEGIYAGSPEPWPAKCGTGYEDPNYGINWRHYTLIAPEYGSNANHTGWVWTIDTTDPAKPFLVSKWRLPGTSTKVDDNGNVTTHPQHYIPGGYIFSPHNGDTGGGGNVYWAHYHAGAWVTDHGDIWNTIAWENGSPEPERGWQAITSLGKTHSRAYYLSHGPDWIDDPANELAYDLADCWASCMIPFNWGLQFDPRGYIIISEMVSGFYVVQYDGDKQADYLFPPLYDQ
tara:strand:- start:19 stop:1950 length:1932 start_codon:yes stop_codon:yes gene_type:complete